MGLVNKAALKAYFQEGDIPKETNFIDVFDSVLSLHADDDQTVAGATTFSDQITSPNITTTTAMKIGDGTYAAPIKLKTSDITSVSTSDTTTELTNFLTPGMVPLSIHVKVTTAISAGHHITSIGSTSDADAFCDGRLAGGESSFADGVLDQAGDEVSCSVGLSAQKSAIAANENVMLTHNGTPTAGAVRVAMVYIDGASVL